jgi:hypothetical protein
MQIEKTGSDDLTSASVRVSSIIYHRPSNRIVRNQQRSHSRAEAAAAAPRLDASEDDGAFQNNIWNQGHHTHYSLTT